MPKLSVIIPVYGVEKYIERCARSLFEQTLDDIEYIFVDDCTQDKSFDILADVIQDYPEREHFVHIVRHATNKGLPFARKTGLSVASGDYIAHCDSDDWVDRDMYRTLLEKALEEKADVVVCDFVRTNGKSFNKYVNACHSTNLTRFLNGCIYQKNPWAIWNKIIKREIYSDIMIFPQESMGEDMVFCFQLLAKCKRIAHVRLPMYMYFYNADSMTKTKTIISCEKNYHSLKTNMDIIVNLIKDGVIPLECRDLPIGFLKFVNSLTLLKVLHLKKYRKIWKQECEQLPVLRFILCRDIPFYYKKAYICILLGIWPSKSMQIKVI